MITESNIVRSACDKWNLEYLENNLGNGGHIVYVSKNHKFKYFDDKKMLSKTNPKGIEFTPPTKVVEMKVQDFMKKLKEFKEGDER